MERVFARPLLAAAAIGLAVGLAGVFNHELWTPDEPRDAGVGREMWLSGDWAVPRLSGKAFLEKPPLYWWAQATVFEAAGRSSAGLARLTSALFGLAALAATFALGRRYFPPEACLLGTLVLCTTYGFLSQSHWVLVDSALAAATTAAFAAYAHAEGRSGPARSALRGVLHASLALAFLAKGVIGVGLVALGLGCHLLWTRRLRRFLGLHLLGGAALVVAVAGLWLWRLTAVEGPDGLREFLMVNQLGRFLPGAVEYTGGHQRPLLYYLRQLPADLLPWTPLALLGALAARRALPSLPAREADGIRLIAAGSVPALVVLSLAGTKRGLYLLPLLPLLALLVGWWMARPVAGARWERGLARAWRAVLVAISGALCLAAPFLDRAWLIPSLVAVGFFGAAAVLLLRAPAATPPGRWLAPVLLVCLGWILGLETAVPANDPNKNMRPLLEAVNRQVPRDAPLYLFEPSETTRGYVAFYTDFRHPVLLDGIPALRALAESDPGAWVVIEGKRERGSYGEVRDAGIPHEVLARHESLSGRVLVLARVGRPP